MVSALNLTDRPLLSKKSFAADRRNQDVTDNKKPEIVLRLFLIRELREKAVLFRTLLATSRGGFAALASCCYFLVMRRF